MKRLTGRKVRKIEGDRTRLFTEIECEDCGRITLERRTGRIQKALQAGCIHCHRESTRKPVKRLTAPHNDGRTKHPLYKTWMDMIDRCYRETHPQFSDYGGRGILICTHWLVSFWHFVEDMGERPEGCSIDRIDNDGPYDPRNCRWATQSQQMKNQRRSSLLSPEEQRLQQNAIKRLQLNPTGKPVGRPCKS